VLRKDRRESLCGSVVMRRLPDTQQGGQSRKLDTRCYSLGRWIAFATSFSPGPRSAAVIAVRTADSFAWVAAFNGRPQDRAVLRSELDRGLWAAKREVKTWPDGDLFERSP